MVRALTVILAIPLLLLTGCGASQSQEDDRGNGAEFADIANSCPLILEGEVQDSADLGDLQQVTVEPLSTDIVVVRDALDRTAGPQLVKLHGITANGISEARRRNGMRIISQSARLAFFAPTGDACTLNLPDGGVGTFGQIFTFQGESLNEILLREHVVFPAPAGEPCGGDALLGCYQTLQASTPPPESIARVTKFLWKPVSDSDGNLVVLVNNFGATIVVNGETLRNIGAGNGYGSQARGTKPGCAYGPVATVQVFDAAGDQIRIFGELDYKITSPCSRVELQ